MSQLTVTISVTSPSTQDLHVISELIKHLELHPNAHGDPFVWDDTTADVFVAALTATARKVYRYAAQHAPEVSISDVLGEFGIPDGPTLGGYMSGRSSAVAKVPGAWDPMTTKPDGYGFSLDAAPVILAALDRADAAHGAN